jgi:flagellar biosynthesis protein FlhG
VTELLFDQAAGLRKLLNQSRLRTIAIASAAPRAGRTTIAVNLAVALAQKGHDVLLLDAASGRNSAAWLLNAEPGADLLDGWHGAAGVEHLIAEGSAGVRVVCAQAAVRALPRANLRHADDLAQLFHTLHQSAGMVLVDPPAGDLSLVSAARETVLVVGPQLPAITDSYRLLKRLHACGSRRVHVLVNRVINKAHGDTIFGNLSSTSRRFLNLPLALIGQVPDDARLARAARMRQSVMDAFADAPSARALRDSADILVRDPSSGEDGFVEFAHRLLACARTLGTSN